MPPNLRLNSQTYTEVVGRLPSPGGFYFAVGRRSSVNVCSLAWQNAACSKPRLIKKQSSDQGRTQGGAEGTRAPPLNGNRLNTNLLLKIVKTQNNYAHAYIAI